MAVSSKIMIETILLPIEYNPRLSSVEKFARNKRSDIFSAQAKTAINRSGKEKWSVVFSIWKSKAKRILCLIL